MFQPTSARLAAATVCTSFRRATTSAQASPASASPAAAVRAAEARGPLPPLQSYTEVPEYYIERGEALKSADPEHEAALKRASLMNDLSAATDIRAGHTILRAKVPTELQNADGEIVHPSGFVVPTPQALVATSELPIAETRGRNAGVVTAAVAERVREEGRLVEAFGSGAARAGTQRLAGKVPFEVDVDGSGAVVHPSGFVPPAPETSFEAGFHSEHRAPPAGSRRDSDA